MSSEPEYTELRARIEAAEKMVILLHTQLEAFADAEAKVSILLEEIKGLRESVSVRLFSYKRQREYFRKEVELYKIWKKTSLWDGRARL